MAKRHGLDPKQSDLHIPVQFGGCFGASVAPECCAQCAYTKCPVAVAERGCLALHLRKNSPPRAFTLVGGTTLCCSRSCVACCQVSGCLDRVSAVPGM